MVAHALNPSTQEVKAGRSFLCEFQTGLIYKSFRTARAVTQRNPFSKNQKEKKERKNKEVLSPHHSSLAHNQCSQEERPGPCDMMRQISEQKATLNPD